MDEFDRFAADWSDSSQLGSRILAHDLRTKFGKSVGVHAAIENLRAEEGDSIEICSDNADFNGQPNSVVLCGGHWTDWHERRFTGDNLLEALQAAVAARRKTEEAAGGVS